jgi:glycerophosphoryl diester phosphodiesterase
MFHKAGVLVHVWTINDPEKMSQLIHAGVDGIVTDRTDLAVSELKN